MAHKTFISYKYSEAQDLRDRIIKALGDDASYYQGETSDSPDLTDTSTENIKNNLKDMMYDTSVTIVIISPHIWKSHATLTLLATQDLPTFGYNMIDPLKSWCWGSILFYPFKISRFS